MRVYIVSIRDCPPKAVFLTRRAADRFVALLKADREVPDDLKEYFPDSDRPKIDIYRVDAVDVSDSAEQAMERDRSADEEFTRLLGRVA